MLDERDGVARWKLEGVIETWLSSRADRGEYWKRLYVFYYRLLDRDYYKNGLKLIDIELTKHGLGDMPSGDRRAYVRDMVYSLHRFGCMFNEYFNFEFPKLSVVGRSSYITDKNRYALYAALNGYKNREVFDNKKKTFELYQNYYGRDCVCVEDESDFSKLEAFVNRHERFLLKPIVGTIGAGVRLVNREDCSNSELLQTCLAERGAMLEELIVQSAQMSSLNSSSVNTVRMPCVLCEDGVHVLAPFIRMGRAGSLIDNAGAGGIFAGVDSDTGIVVSKGTDKKANRYIRHPDTGAQIVGFKIPRWNEALNLVSELSRVLPEQRFIGWDLALTDGGWAVVEGNARSEFYPQELANGEGYLREMERLIEMGPRHA